MTEPTRRLARAADCRCRRTLPWGTYSTLITIPSGTVCQVTPVSKSPIRRQCAFRPD